MVRLFLSISAIVTASVTSWAGCNCNVPPAPAMYPGGGGGWNAPVPQAGMAGGYANYGMAGGYPAGAPGGYPPAGGYPGTAGYGAPTPGAGYGPAPLPYGGMVATNGPHWAPGGYEPRIGSPTYYYDPAGGQYVVTGNPYYDHYGPGFQRHSLHGHYSFPYYSYRTPWYFPGRAVYNRNTNFAW